MSGAYSARGYALKGNGTVMQFIGLERLRSLMREEIDFDLSRGNLYISPRLTTDGAAAYPDLLKQAASAGNAASLASALQRPGILETHEQRRKPKGGYSTVAVPVTAHETLAEGEFNRFFMRAVCRWALDNGYPVVVCYRAKQVAVPRADSEAKIGREYDAERLLEDLRENVGTDTALGLPPGPNSGLSIKPPKD